VSLPLVVTQHVAALARLNRLCRVVLIPGIVSEQCQELVMKSRWPLAQARNHEIAQRSWIVGGGLDRKAASSSMPHSVLSSRLT